MASKTSKFKWGVPVSIPVPPYGDGDIPPWSDLKFNPLGIYNLCHHIGVLAGYFVGSCIWEFNHVEGTNSPGAPALPECVKADIYLPPVFVSKHPEAHPAIAQIVQTFIEEKSRIYYMPTCLFASFSCPPYGSLTQSVSSDHSHNDKFPVSPHAEPAMSQDSDIMDDSEPLSQTTLDFTNSLEEIAKLKAELKGAGHREDSLIPQIHTLSAAYRKRMQKLLMFRSN
ncbi:hypothetical protein L208DRAFT_1378310 [Tricholoma matsutake]|nr:hypothetical protein L208DRAFT_1378310 [Tricholoma matsutake 945]